MVQFTSALQQSPKRYKLKPTIDSIVEEIGIERDWSRRIQCFFFRLDHLIRLTEKRKWGVLESWNLEYRSLHFAVMHVWDNWWPVKVYLQTYTNYCSYQIVYILWICFLLSYTRIWYDRYKLSHCTVLTRLHARLQHMACNIHDAIILIPVAVPSWQEMSQWLIPLWDSDWCETCRFSCMGRLICKTVACHWIGLS